MSAFARIFVGAMGGMAAVCTKFLGQDYQSIMVLVAEDNWAEIYRVGVGYIFVTPILLFLGGLLGWASRETQPLKLIAIGVAAPGLVTTWSGTSDYSKLPSPAAPTRAGIIEMLSPVGTALAGERDGAVGPASGEIRLAQSQGRVIQRGFQTFFNVAPEPRFWVIVGSFRDEGEAAALAQDINREAPDMNAFIGLRQPGNPFYPVIVGDYVEADAAEILKARAARLEAVRAGGSEVYLSSFAERRL